MSDNDFPRPIDFADIKPGDKVKRASGGAGVLTEHTITVGSVRYAPPLSAVYTANGFCGYIDAPSVTWTLLDRPSPRGPAWNAPMGSLWTNDGVGVWARTDGTADGGSALFRAITNGSSTTLWEADDDALIDSLVPFVPEPTLRERLRDNVVEAAQDWSATYSNPTAELPEATRLFNALRAHEQASEGGA